MDQLALVLPKTLDIPKPETIFLNTVYPSTSNDFMGLDPMCARADWRNFDPLKKPILVVPERCCSIGPSSKLTYESSPNLIARTEIPCYCGVVLNEVF